MNKILTTVSVIALISTTSVFASEKQELAESASEAVKDIAEETEKKYEELKSFVFGDESENLEFSEEVEDKNAKIAPLILLSIVENAFKHGASGETENAEIKIELEQAGNSFAFDVFNTKSSVEQKDETDYTKGIGVENVRKQLDLVYPDRYIFDVEDGEKSYKVSLKLELNSDED